MLLIALTGCGKSSVAREHLGYNMDSAYMMLTRDVNMLVSDSGLTRYRLISPLWVIYDRPDRKQWVFEEGLTMYSVDSINPGNELVVADTVIFHVSEDMWELIGHVRIHGLKGERLYTPHLYWQRREKRLYSDDTTYFATEGNELRGSHFEAADNLSWYSIYNNAGDLSVKEKPIDSTSHPFLVTPEPIP